MTTLSTHVLDTARGLPAAGIVVSLDGVATATTDADGRAQLGELADGSHSITFAAGAYLGDDAFYDDVTVAFRVRGEPHLHVPLLLSPYGYSTYRGS